MNTAIAVKAFIVDDNNKALLIKRRNNDAHDANKWEIPGGRLNSGESPFSGLQREVFEEVGLTIDIGSPLEIRHFTRDDGQAITMIIFLCKLIRGEVVISEEHNDFVWKKIPEVKGTICPYFYSAVDAYEKYFLDVN